MINLPDSPRSLGDLVGLGFRLVRKNWKTVVSIFLVPSIFFSMALSGSQFCFVHWVQAQSLDPGFFAAHMACGLGLALVMIACQWEIALRSCAFIRCVLLVDSEYSVAYEYARRRQWEIMTVYAVSFLLPTIVATIWTLLFVATLYLGTGDVLGKVLCVVLGFLEGLTFVVAFSYSLLYTAIAFVAVCRAESGIKDSLKEGFVLSREAVMRGLSYICLLLTSIFIVTLPLYLPVVLLGIWEGYVQGKMNEINFPIYLRVLEAISSCVINMLSLGAALSGVALFCRDVKMRRQGLDIDEGLSKLAYQPSSPHSKS